MEEVDGVNKKEDLPKEENIDDILEGIDLSEKTEMGDFAEQIHRARPSGSNLTPDETSANLVCQIVFPVLGMVDNISQKHLELAKSRGGWATEKVVQGAGGIQNTRSGGSIGGWMKERLFTPK